MGIGETLRDLGRYIMYYPSLVPVCGSVNATVFLCYIISWDGYQRDPDGWIYKTQKEIEEETGLTRSMLDQARTHLKTRALVEEKLRGVPATMHYRVKYRELNEAWEAHLQTRLQKTDKLDPPVGTPQPRLRKSNKLARGKAARQSEGKQQTNTDTTSDTSQKKTQKRTPRRKKTSEMTPEEKRAYAEEWRQAQAAWKTLNGR